MKKIIATLAAGCLLLGALTGCSKEKEVTEAPSLTLTYAGEETGVIQGGYKWAHGDRNGMAEVAADASSKIAGDDILTKIALQDGETEATLSFSTDPDEVEIYCWPAEERSEADEESGEAVDIVDNTIQLKDEYVYWVNATWDSSNYKGYVEYSFYATESAE